jgi:hypothetical protein
MIKKIVRGKDLSRGYIDYKDLYLLYIPWKFQLENYTSIKNYLLNYESDLKKRPEVKAGRVDWFALSRYASDYFPEFEKKKLIYPNIANKLFAVYDSGKYYTVDTCYFITSENLNLKFLGALLSSKTLNFAFKFLGTPLRGNYYKLSKIFIENLSIYAPDPIEETKIVNIADKLLEINHKLHKEIDGFKHWISKEFNIEKLSQKLEKYYELSEDEFIDELKKKKVNTKLRKNLESLEREFTGSMLIIEPLLQQIDETENKIDQMVYDLYGLKQEEIKIIEDNLNR